MYQVENPINKAMDGMSQASGTYGRMMRKTPEPEKPGPTVGGTLMSGVGGAVTGAQAGSLLGASAAVPATATSAAIPAAAALGMGPVGWAGAGLAVGIGSYLFS